MKNVVYLCLCFLILSSCETVRFKPPSVEKRLVSVERDESGAVLSVACIITSRTPPYNSDIFPIDYCENTIGVSILPRAEGVPSDYEALNNFYSDKLKRLEVCLTTKGKRCK